MAEYNEQSGYIRQGDKPTSTYNAHQDEFGFKEGNQAPNSSSGYGDDVHSGVGGPKSAYGDLKEGGTFDHGTSEQTQFGLEGKTGSYGREGADPQLNSSSAYRDDSDFDTLKSDFYDAPRGKGSVPGGGGVHAGDPSLTDGAKKGGLMNKIKQKLPGQHQTAEGGVTPSDPNAPPKKGIMEKVKEKLPGQHGSSDAGI